MLTFLIKLPSSFFSDSGTGVCNFLTGSSMVVRLYSLDFTCSLFILLSTLEKCTPVDFLTPSQPMRNSETLVSADKIFELGFFRPSNDTSDSYLGIWYYNIPSQTVVWVANRDKPLTDSSGSLKIGDDGNLVIADQLERVIWSSNAQNLSSKSTVARLLDSGNLVLTDNTADSSLDSYLWQSFEHPTDTLLPEMRLGWNLSSGAIWQLTSWKNLNNPSPGEFTYSIDSHGGFPYLVLRKGSTKLYRAAPSFRGAYPGNPAFSTRFVNDSSDVYYYIYDLQNTTTRTRLKLNYKGTLERYLWIDQSMQWTLLYYFPGDPCDQYAKCGPNTVCNVISYLGNCSCLTGYTPKSPQDLDMLVSSSGCIRKNPLNCSGAEGFTPIKGVKVPDVLQFEMNASMTPTECRGKCLRNCTCTAYAITNGSGDGRGCGLWFGDLVDIRFDNSYGRTDLFIRVMASNLESKQFPWKWVAPLGTIVLVAFAVLLCLAFQKKRKAEGENGSRSAASQLTGLVRLGPQVNDEEGFDLQIFDAISISEATNNFSISNKLGEGGFGPVYKGRFPNGQEIAVKRLSLDSHQGLNEFKNEVMLIAKLQHRNLVRLLGCCIEGEERMLIYEYMPNKSLDFFIFGSGVSLPWRTRFNIIVGIARGILYLHRDSRLKIVHRDLKASNVLLDSEMNAKISDFGMARAFGENLSLARTQRIVGTYGYMSPEYAIDGVFSVKSDVFSFGVLVLEIISGKRNREFHHAEHNFNLLGHAWKSWKDGKAFEMIDSNLEAALYLSEIMRCIQIGLLCVQQHPEDQPTMSFVVLMLDSGICALPEPKEPGFYTERSHDQYKVNTNSTDCSINEMTLTLLNGR